MHCASLNHISLLLLLAIAFVRVGSFKFFSAKTKQIAFPLLSKTSSLFSSQSTNNEIPPEVAPAATEPEPQGSGIASLYQEVLSLLAKVPYSDLRQLIEKCKPSNLPDITADSEAHIAMALDAAWTYSGGDWGALLTLIQEDLAVAASEATFQLEIALAAGQRMSEKRVKELIVYHGTPNSIPKLDKRRHTGKLLKDDFVVELIDILREKYQNDYQKVANILETDYLATKKSGFGL